MNNQVNLKSILECDNFEELLKDLNFESGMKLLEQLCQNIESGDVSLDQAVSSYERGSKLVEFLREKLSVAEKKIKVIAVNGVKEDTELARTI